MRHGTLLTDFCFSVIITGNPENATGGAAAPEKIPGNESCPGIGASYRKEVGTMAENGNAGILCDENIRRAFSGAGDFVARQVRCGEHTLFAYSIDGLTSGGDTSDYVIKPI